MTANRTERVTMLWPPDIKEQVRAKVGQRGLTEYVLQAVSQHLQGSDRQNELEHEVGQLRFLAQALADVLAMSGDSAARLESFQELELPTWLETDGWPSDFAEVVEKARLNEERVAEVGEPLPEVPDSSYAEDAVSLPEPEPEPAVVPEPEPEPAQPEPAVERKVRPKKGDLFDRVAAIAAQKGIDFGDHKLTPASEIEKPEPKEEGRTFESVEEVVMRASDNFTEVLEEVRAEPEVVTEVRHSNACPNCGAELVGGECWECM